MEEGGGTLWGQVYALLSRLLPLLFIVYIDYQLAQTYAFIVIKKISLLGIDTGPTVTRKFSFY